MHVWAHAHQVTDVRAMPRYVKWLMLAFILLLLTNGLTSSSAEAAGGPGRLEGVASCAGSTCHGRAEGGGFD